MLFTHSFFLVAAGVALVPDIAAQELDALTANGIAGCQGLAALFPHNLFYPNTTTYMNESTRLWSETCLLSPSCVFAPENAQDISDALKVITKTETHFSIRSGGHMPVPGAASLSKGVMIAMTNIHTLELVQNNTIARVGPGQTWEEVYTWISGYGLAVAGGRYGQVGVGGLLLGGGINYFGNRYGWSHNTVVRYQVVIADGSILEVSAQSHPDLFWALKGGSNNFGIVTRYDMRTISVTSAYEGATVWVKAALPAFLQALGDFVAPGGGNEDPLVAINPAIALTPGNGTVEATNIVFHHSSDSNPVSLANFSSIPGAFYNDTSVRPSWTSIAAELDQPAFAARTSRQLFWSVGIKPTLAAIELANTTFVGGALSELNDIPDPDLRITVAYQPISQAWLAAAVKAGGDAMDLDPADGGFISLLVSATWSLSSTDAPINDFMRKTTASLITQAKAIDAYYPFITLNDAGPGQDPYPLYGKGKSLPRLKAINAKYDPQGVFGKLEASGFKL